MEPWTLALICALAAAVILLLVRIVSVHRGVREISRGLDEKLSTDTNTLISVSTGDREVRRLAAELNCRLRTVRDERRKLQNGDNELKSAITNVSHDLRTPLTAICGYLDLLETEEVSPQARRYLDIIRERTDAMSALTQELFRYSVVSSTANVLSPEQVNLNSLLEKSLAAAYAELSERGITPEISICSAPVVRVLDPAAVSRIFANILSNAAKYSDGDLAVTLCENGCATFTNSAHGLTAVDVQRLFDRFYTVENAKGSTGLGLSIAKLLTEKLGGELTAELSDGNLSINLKF